MNKANKAENNALGVTPPTAGRAGSWTRPAMICLLLAAVTFVVFWPVKNYDYIYYDDHEYVSENPHVLAGLTWSGVVWAFRVGYAANWHPLTWLSHMADMEMFGAAAAGAHFTNLCLHIVNVMLLFLLLRRLTGALWRSALVAGLFALHPLHVESVAWISERKDVLSTFFGFASLIFYARYVEQFKIQPAASKPSEGGSIKSKAFYGLTFLFFALGLMSKPMLVTLPFVLLLLDYWPLRRFQPAALDSRSCQVRERRSTLLRPCLEKLPLFMMGGIACVVTLAAQRGTVQSVSEFSVSERMGNALVSYARYMGKTFWPVNLALPYPYPNSSWPWVQVFWAAMLVIVLSVGALCFGRRRPYLFVGWFWFLGMLIPVIGLVQVGVQAMADRYTYVPLVGLFIVVAWSMGEMVERRLSLKPFVAAVAVAMLVACALRTARQVGYWRDSGTLFTHAIAATKDNDVAYCGLGIFLREAGQTDAAEKHFRTALRINPGNIEALGNFGSLLSSNKQYDEAIACFETALVIKPDHLKMRMKYGKILQEAGRIADGIKQLQNVVLAAPDDINGHGEFGKALARAGRDEEAIQQFEQVLRLMPEDVAIRYNLAVVLGRSGKIAAAIEQYGLVLKQDRGNTEAQNGLGVALILSGKLDEAIGHYHEALRHKPDYAEAHGNLGYALSERGRLDEAIAQFKEAFRLNPQYSEAHYNLGLALLKLGRKDEAITQFREVLRLVPGDADTKQQLRALGVPLAE